MRWAGSGAMSQSQQSGALLGAQTAVIFTGPQAYVSPDWCETDGLVPTWNYQTVHMQGAPSLLDSEETLAVITDLSAQQEQELLPKPWFLDKMTADALRMQRRAIIGMRTVLDIERSRRCRRTARSRSERGDHRTSRPRRFRPGGRRDDGSVAGG